MNSEERQKMLAEIARLQEAKRRALAIADERAKESTELRGVLRYIAAQAKSDHPGALRVILINAEAALDGSQDKTREMLRAAEQPPQAFVEAKAERDAGWPRDFEQGARET